MFGDCHGEKRFFLYLNRVFCISNCLFSGLWAPLRRIWLSCLSPPLSSTLRLLWVSLLQAEQPELFQFLLTWEMVQVLTHPCSSSRNAVWPRGIFMRTVCRQRRQAHPQETTSSGCFASKCSLEAGTTLRSSESQGKDHISQPGENAPAAKCCRPAINLAQALS